jgi:hypothetical protein
LCQKQFPSLWHVRCKPWTYLASRLAHLQADRNKLPIVPCDLGVPSGASKTITEPMVRLVQTKHLSCTDTNNVSKQTETRFHMTHITYEFYQVRPKLFLSIWYVWHKPCSYFASRLALSPKWTKNELLVEPRHLGVPSVVSKMISVLMVSSAQTMHLSCVKNSTIFKQTETSFQLSLVT